MNKYIAMLAIVAGVFYATTTEAATLLFSRAQFQAHKATADTPAYTLTAPLVYKGTVSFQRNQHRQCRSRLHRH